LKTKNSGIVPGNCEEATKFLAQVETSEMPGVAQFTSVEKLGVEGKVYMAEPAMNANGCGTNTNRPPAGYDETSDG
jgi:hypothetical protein